MKEPGETECTRGDTGKTPLGLFVLDTQTFNGDSSCPVGLLQKQRILVTGFWRTEGFPGKWLNASFNTKSW